MSGFIAREMATLGGGCFWCLEAVFERLKGVDTAVSGYCGGHTPHPNYREVCAGNSGHAEVVQLAFDPEVVSYREVLEVFFAVHDPTSLNRQGNDVGSQYRSAIFYHTPVQRQVAEQLIAELNAASPWEAPIVTEVLPVPAFHPAEAYHQHYFRKNPGEAYCAAVVGPKVAKFRRQFAAKLKPGGP